MFLRHRFLWLVISVFLVLIVGACASEPTLEVTEVMTAEQITAVGCDPAASEGQIRQCVVNAIGCNPRDTELKVKACMEDKIENVYRCGTVGETPPNEIAACMVGCFQDPSTCEVEPQ